MIRFLRKHRRALFIATATIFMIGIFVGLGGYLVTEHDTTDTIAVVGTTKIPYNRFLTKVNQFIDMLQQKGAEVSDATRNEVKQAMLRELVIEQLLADRADELGIVVTDDEVARDIQNTPAFQRGGAFDYGVYRQVIQMAFHDTQEGYENSRRRTMKAGKFKQLVLQAAKLSPEEVREAYSKDKGSLKDFEKSKDEFEWKLQQNRAIELLNYQLKLIGGRVEIRTFLDKRESGM